MGRHSSDSESSRTSRKAKSKFSRRRSQSRERSRSPTRKCKKKARKDNSPSDSKKSKKHYKGRSRSSSKSKRRDRDGGSRRKKEERRRGRRSRSSSSSSDGGRGSRRREQRRRRRSSSASGGSRSSATSASPRGSVSPKPRGRFRYDPDELLDKLNRAAVEAMAANSKQRLAQDPLASIEMQIRREDIINELRASGETGGWNFDNGGRSLSVPGPAPLPPLLSASAPTSFLDTGPAPISSEPLPTSTSDHSGTLLHPNFLLEKEEDKLNRWAKKLLELRQRMYGLESVV